MERRRRGRRAGRRSGSPPSDWPSGSIIAGWPVRLNQTVNGEKVKTRRQYSWTSSIIMSIQPIGGQGAEAGREQHVVALVEGGHLAAEPVHGLGGADVVGGGDLLAELAGVEGDVLDLAVLGGAARRGMAAEVDDGVDGGQGDEGRDDGAPSTWGSASSTWWPRSAQSWTVSWRVARYSGATGAPLGAFVVKAMRRAAAASAPTSSRKGRAGGGAAYGIARARAGGGVEQRGGVADSEGDGVLGGAAAEALAGVRASGCCGRGWA